MLLLLLLVLVLAAAAAAAAADILAVPQKLFAWLVLENRTIPQDPIFGFGNDVPALPQGNLEGTWSLKGGT